MIAVRYGDLPIVRKTGGLADTVIDYIENPEEGNGFVFEEATKEGLLEAIDRALSIYANKRKWTIIAKRSMKRDFSWKTAASRYLEYYRKAVEKKRPVTV